MNRSFTPAGRRFRVVRARELEPGQELDAGLPAYLTRPAEAGFVRARTLREDQEYFAPADELVVAPAEVVQAPAPGGAPRMD